MKDKMIGVALFAIALGLFAVALAIHENTQQHGRYALSGQFRLDTKTGEVTGCKWIADHVVDCEGAAAE